VGVSAMKLLDKGNNKYDLSIHYQFGFGFHIQYKNDYYQELNVDFMGFSLYLNWGCIEDFND
jgi:hypothetical protein